MPEIADGRELRVVTGKNHLSTSQRNLGNHVKQGNLAHKAFVKAQRALEVSFLDPVLETGQGFPGIELPTRNVRTGAAGHTLQLLQTTLHEMRLADTRWPVQEVTPLFTSELQSQLLDITFPLPEDRDLWHHVWSPTDQVEDDSVFVRGHCLAIEDAKEVPLSRAFHREILGEEPRRGAMHRLATTAHQKLLGLVHLFARRAFILSLIHI